MTATQTALFDDPWAPLRPFHRCWQRWAVSPPLAGCGPLHPGNPNPYWPAYASAHAWWWFDVGGFQEAWGAHLAAQARAGGAS